MPDIDLTPQRIQARLKFLRDKIRPGLSDRAFGLKAGISYTQVQRMEGRVTAKNYKRDTGSSPTIERLRKYLKALNYSVTQFFSELENQRYEQPSATVDDLRMHAQLQDLLDLGEEVKRRVNERFDELQAWLRWKESVGVTARLLPFSTKTVRERERNNT